MLKGKKTYMAGVACILTAAAGYTSGDIILADALQQLFTGLIAIFLRNGIK